MVRFDDRVICCRISSRGWEVYSRRTGVRIGRLGSDTSRLDFGDGFAILNRSQVLDSVTWNKLQPAEGRRFHSALQRGATFGRLHLDGIQLWDLPTETVIDQRHTDSVCVILRLSEGAVYVVGEYGNWIPLKPTSTDATFLRLWAEVVTRKRLVVGIDEEALTEREWNDRRRSLSEQLPPSPSPLLSTIANDQAHWLREEAKRLGEPQQWGTQPWGTLVGVLDRLIAIEPTWWYRDRRGEALVNLRRWDEAADDFIAAARDAGEWYWRTPPEILDRETQDSLLVAAEPEARMRDQLGLSPAVVEVAAHYLRRLQQDEARLANVAFAVGSRPYPPSEDVEVALRLVRELMSREADDSKWQAWYGLLLYRQARYEEALAALVKANSLFDPHKGSNTHSSNDEISYYSILSMAHLRLDHERAARDELAKARARLGTADPLAHPLYHEAEALILDAHFPADPFAP